MGERIRKITDSIRGGKLLVADGAWGTMLQAMGLKPGECPDAWNLSHAEDVFWVARRYVEAGADIIETNSFGASRVQLAHWKLQDQAARINRIAAEISRKAAGDDVLVMGSIGPTARMILTGEVSEGELYEAFREQAVSLQEGGADALCIETMSALDEALIAVRAAKENTGLEIICTFTFNRLNNGSSKTMMGVSPRQFAGAMENAGADIIGTNCGNGSPNMIPIVFEIKKAASGLPVLVQANAGLPEIHSGRLVYPETPEFMAGHVQRLVEAGASVIGGCCGTTPEHIRAIRRAVDNLKK